MQPLTPFLTGILLAVFQACVVFPGSFLIPIVLCVIAIAMFSSETWRIAKTKRLSFPDISVFTSKEEYIKSFQSDYVPPYVEEKETTANLTYVAVLGGVVGILSYLYHPLTAILNIALVAFYLTYIANTAGLKSLRPTTALYFFVVSFAIFTQQSTLELGVVLPLAGLFCKNVDE